MNKSSIPEKTQISIAIVLYNHSNDNVKRLIDNVHEQTESFANVQLFFVNNSPQNVRLEKFLRKQEQQQNVIVLTPKTNQGFGMGNNMVLPYLKSDYHFIMNPDVEIPSGKQLEKMIGYMDQNNDCGLLAPLIKYPSGEIQHLLKRESNVFDMALRFLNLPIMKQRQNKFVCLPDGYRTVHEAENVPGSFMVFRTKTFKQIKGFDDSYFLYMEDSDITMKTRQVSKVMFYPKAFVYHEWQRENRKSWQGVQQMLRSMFVYFNKWGWKMW
ncbi:glycosyltransferase [Lactiplantibacillus plantarum]|uniref:glycosyltransferase n=1 Tax=Lactiplantibacillus plantarum TaxID=1590 RepID=UPI001BABB64D|nr:glycosyltransferase [Lactiplantibacillus plantarum]MBS0953474.1 glycosyltransferase [Lactiplantibacillus plantarum]MBS0956742.1 glycosyltransferase [Lactiplantibacillus plantarum]